MVAPFFCCDCCLPKPRKYLSYKTIRAYPHTDPRNQWYFQTIWDNGINDELYEAKGFSFDGAYRVNTQLELYEKFSLLVYDACLSQFSLLEDNFPLEKVFKNDSGEYVKFKLSEIINDTDCGIPIYPNGEVNFFKTAVYVEEIGFCNA